MTATGDISRILNLPYRLPLEGEEYADKWTRILARSPGAFRLLPVQGIACEELHRAPEPRGIVVMAGVGHGKTGISFLAGRVCNAVRPLLLIPPNLVAKTRKDLKYWAKYYAFPQPTILSYSKLSTATSTDILSRLRPDLIVCDEAHALRHPHSARTRRVIRYLRENPACRFVPLSGSFTTSSIDDYAHLSEMALREGSFLPLSPHILEHWSAVLDVAGIPSSESCGTMAPLVARYGGEGRTFRDKAREAFAKKLRVTPGVIITDDASVDVSLSIRCTEYDLDTVVEDAIDLLDTEWTLPNGEQITDAFQYYRHAMNLSAGFYYEIVWPNGQKDQEWLDARKAWQAVIRDCLRGNARENFDSPKLITDAAIAGRAPRGVIRAWEAWARVKDRPEPPSRAVWLSPALPVDVLERVTGAPPTLVWFGSRAMGEALASLGLPVIDDGRAIPDVSRTPIACLSHHKHSEGKNLQAWSESLVIEPPSNGKTWEQLLGRTHRLGQSESVTLTVYTFPDAFNRAVAKARREAIYVEQSTGQKQRLNLARWANWSEDGSDEIESSGIGDGEE